jgi:hypothetical protein
MTRAVAGWQGEVALVGVAAQVWSRAPQRAAQAIDRLMALRLVSGVAIITWVFGSPGVRSLDDELASGTAWEVFYNAVNKMLARTQVCPYRGLLCVTRHLVARVCLTLLLACALGVRGGICEALVK